MEVVEHVADLPAFLEASSACVKAGGACFLATINRTAKAFALAIVGAEYVLRWVPRGTHEWSKFVRPAELVRQLQRNGLRVEEAGGVTYHPMADRWALSQDLSVNYLVYATKGSA